MVQAAEGAEAPFHSPDPQAVAASQLTAFARHCAARMGRPELAGSYAALHRFSVDDAATFWRLWVEWSDVAREGPLTPAIVGADVETARFFPALRVSWPEAVMAPLTSAGQDGADDDAWLAIVGRDEAGGRTALTRGELRGQVRRLASALAGLGMRSGDRVLAVARNRPESIVAALAVTSLGASWSAIAPDMGVDSAVARAVQLRPRWVFAHGAYPYQGRRHEVVDKVRTLVDAVGPVAGVIMLDGALDGSLDAAPGAVASALAVPGARGAADAPSASPPVHGMAQLVAGAAVDAAVAAAPSPLRPFDHPLFILFSSGTTGPPKCIVHGHGGTLLEHLKELRLHCDLRHGDVLYFHTTTAWMMWNWLVSALATGCAIALYDGSVTFPEQDALLTLLAEEGVTHFGTSPAYLRFCEDAGVTPPPLPRLRAVLSTGSILYDGQYDWVRDHLGTTWVQSISGGTDIIGCFVLGNPNLPVYRGDSQCVSLGHDVRVAIDGSAQREGFGELICTAPFPSRPVGLYGDDGARFHAAYFDGPVAGAWTHGDFVSLTERGAGRSARILGRSDGVLNIRGVRIGPAELYAILEDVPEVVEALAVDQPWPRAIGGRRLVLLVVLQPGITLDRPLTLGLKRTLKQRGSMNHVPDVIKQVAELPRTLNGKRTERAAADTLARRPVRNLAALANPECLDALRADPDLLPDVKPQR